MKTERGIVITAENLVEIADLKPYYDATFIALQTLVKGSITDYPVKDMNDRLRVVVDPAAELKGCALNTAASFLHDGALYGTAVIMQTVTREVGEDLGEVDNLEQMVTYLIDRFPFLHFCEGGDQCD